ncbi:DMT family transporter [Yangia mangrovi]|uniref:DMT family transporter n=1 Tax=Alloyangia mangrovi TaxID=1779329 RepID=A0ABT2KK58_9RHOB|nr:DMT family transporter [Alloyangia mangrovi]MCT4370123.1 DMT family transporter [Alloyangia mangrovi]
MKDSFNDKPCARRRERRPYTAMGDWFVDWRGLVPRPSAHLPLLWGIGMVTLIGSLLAVEPTLNRMGAALGAGSLGLAAWSNLVGALLCLGLSIFRNGPPRLHLRHVPFFLAWTLVLGCLFKVWLVVVAREVEASTIALVVSTRAFMVFGLAAVIAMERPTLRRCAGLGVGLAAISGLLLARGADIGGTSALWLFAALGLPLLLAVHTLLMAMRPKDLDSFATTGIMLLLAGSVLAILAQQSGQLRLPPEAFGPLALIILTVGATAGVAVALALDLVSRVGPVFASQMAYVQTIAGILWSMLLLKEDVPPMTLVAAALVFLGFWLVQPRARPRTA